MNCLQCGGKLTKKWQAKYCSRECMWKYQRKRRAEASEAKRSRVCEMCGKEFIMHNPSGKARRGEVREGRFCSKRCKGEWVSKQAMVGRSPKTERRWICVICGSEMRSYGVYCSDECRKESARRKSFDRSSAKKELKKIICKECGNQFIPEYGNKKRLFCSTECCGKNARRCRRQKERARLRNAKIEIVNATEIFIRDGWKCQLCGKKLKPKHRGTYRDDAPELDHIIPLSMGGDHSRNNTQCACRKCNSEKGGVERGQMRIFG